MFTNSEDVSIPNTSVSIVSNRNGNNEPPAATASVENATKTLTDSSTVQVKEERHDEAEIQELANKIREAQKQTQQQNQLGRPITNILVSGNTTVTPISAGSSSAVAGPSNQASILNFFPKKTSQQTSNNSDNNSSNDARICDELTLKGHFGWQTFGKIHLPYIFRMPTDKYCAVRMVEMKILNKYLNYLHSDIYSSCTCVRSYYITENESRLFNEINHKHCDGEFGRELFTVKDLVVSLSDVHKFYHFLDICYKKLVGGSKGPMEKCGFIRINKDSVVPYTIRNGEQVVPLFYFEGETENLRQKADYLSGWDLAYLKFCCKVQGIRNELFSSESVAVISLAEIKSYFPVGTEFEDYWPSKVIDSNLLIATKNASNSVNWTRQPAVPPPKTLPAASATISRTNQQHLRDAVYPGSAVSNSIQRLHTANNLSMQNNNIPATVQTLSNRWQLGNGQSGLPDSILSHGTNDQVYRMAMQQHQHHQQQQQPARAHQASRNPVSGMTQVSHQYHYNNGVMPIPTIECGQAQPPPPLVRSTSQAQYHRTVPALDPANVMLHHYQQQHQQQQHSHQHQQRAQTNSARTNRNNQPPNQSLMPAAMQLRMHAAALPHQQPTSSSSPSSSKQRLNVIPDIPVSTHSEPYKLQNMYIENTTVPCVNMKAFNDSEMLMSLKNFQECFFPNVTIDHCKKFMGALGLEMFKGNKRQTELLRDSDKSHSESIPLIKARDAIRLMPQLQYMVRNNSVVQEQQTSKRLRIS